MKNGDTRVRDNPIWKAWHEGDKEARLQFVLYLCQFYNRLVCNALQRVGQCIKDKGV